MTHNVPVYDGFWTHRGFVEISEKDFSDRLNGKTDRVCIEWVQRVHYTVRTFRDVKKSVTLFYEEDYKGDHCFKLTWKKREYLKRAGVLRGVDFKQERFCGAI